MKLYFPILFVFIFLLSCDKKTKINSEKQIVQNNIAYYFKLAKDPNSSQEIQLKNFELAQNAALKIKNDSMIFKILCAKLYYFPEQSATCFKKLKKMVALSKITKHQAYLANILAEDYLSKKQFDSAFYQYNLSKNLYERENDSLRTGYNLLKIAQIQQTFNDFYESEKTLTEALVFLKNTNETSYLSEVNNMLGIAYNNLEAFDLAIGFFNKAQNLSTGTLSKEVFKNNIALVYIRSKKYQKAIEILENLKTYDSIENHLFLKALVYHNLGIAKFKADGKSGLELMQTALEIAKKDNNPKEIMEIYADLSYYFSKKDKIKAIGFSKLAYQLATTFSAIDYRIEMLKTLVRLSENRASKKYAIQNIYLSDSIFKVRQLSKNQFAKIRYDSKTANKENAKLKNENKLTNQLHKEKLFYYSVIFALFLALCMVLYFLIISKHKREKLKNTYQTETRIAKKVHDELANDVYNAMTFVITQDLNNFDKKEKLIASLDKVYLQTRDISRENSTVEIGVEFANYLKSMLSEYTSENQSVIIKGLDSINLDLINENKKITIYRVLQELMVNLKKHSKASICVISFQKIKKKLQINYADNGIGIGVGDIIFKNGLLNVETRIQAIKGKITFDTSSEKGLKVSFSIPI